MKSKLQQVITEMVQDSVYTSNFEYQAHQLIRKRMAILFDTLKNAERKGAKIFGKDWYELWKYVQRHKQQFWQSEPRKVAWGIVDQIFPSVWENTTDK